MQRLLRRKKHRGNVHSTNAWDAGMQASGEVLRKTSPVIKTTAPTRSRRDLLLPTCCWTHRRCVERAVLNLSGSSMLAASRTTCHFCASVQKNIWSKLRHVFLEKLQRFCYLSNSHKTDKVCLQAVRCQHAWHANRNYQPKKFKLVPSSHFVTAKNARNSTIW